MEEFQHSIMAGVVSAFSPLIMLAFTLNAYFQTGRSPVKLTQAARLASVSDVRDHWQTIG
jgi:hypothetical protein